MQGVPQVVVSRAGAATRRRLEDEGFEVELWSLGPGGGLVGLGLGAEGILYVDQGEARVEAAGLRIDLEPGDQVALPAEADFSIQTLGSRRLVWLAARRVPAAEAPGRSPPRRRRRRGLRLFPGPR